MVLNLRSADRFICRAIESSARLCIRPKEDLELGEGDYPRD
jgi:hypothetical protein